MLVICRVKSAHACKGDTAIPGGCSQDTLSGQALWVDGNIQRKKTVNCGQMFEGSSRSSFCRLQDVEWTIWCRPCPAIILQGWLVSHADSDSIGQYNSVIVLCPCLSDRHSMELGGAPGQVELVLEVLLVKRVALNVLDAHVAHLTYARHFAQHLCRGMLVEEHHLAVSGQGCWACVLA